MPGRHEFDCRQRGKDTNRKPASAHNVATSSRQRDPSGCHEAGHDGTDKPSGFATTIRKATQREAAASNDPIKSRALPTHPDGAWRWTTQKQARRARVRVPERNWAERPSKFAKQRHPPRCHEARPSNRNDVSTMERCCASRWNQTRTTHQTRQGAPRIRKQCPESPEQRPASGCHEARPARMPKRIGEWALPTETPVFERHSP